MMSAYIVPKTRHFAPLIQGNIEFLQITMHMCPVFFFLMITAALTNMEHNLGLSDFITNLRFPLQTNLLLL